MDETLYIERELEGLSDEEKSKIFDPTSGQSQGWSRHWQWLAENGHVPEGMERAEFREMVEEWQEFAELEAIWGEEE